MSRVLVGLALVCAPLYGADAKPNLLPTAAVRQRIRAIRSPLEDVSLNLKLSKKQRDTYFYRLKAEVSRFIIAQLEAEPELQPRHLRDQLLRILGRKGREAGVQYDSQSIGQMEPEEPFVQRRSFWKPEEKGKVLWGINYSGTHINAFGGNRIVVESYVVREGKATLAGRGGSELDGFNMQAQRIFLGESTLGVVIHGIFEWSSGHVLPAKAVLYEISETGVRKIWERAEPQLRIIATSDGFILTYHDERRHFADPAKPWGQVRMEIIEVYVAFPTGLTRVARQRY